ncbi:cyclic nucleotide-binding domain-containing protein [Kitasatospora sp. NPDC088346]|uniref:cyclic nucleotide-binding domain-containing protein n=1 Tax=Kitasatospora sp. NPDC088346 TaxID=3364073 RepID=UPI0038003988
MTAPQHGFLTALAPAHRDRLAALAREVPIPAGARIFEEGGPADRFWIVRSGGVALDVHIPGRPPAVVETLGEGDLLGWSWLFAPYRWHLGARARGEVRAAEFDAGRVRAACAQDPAFGLAVTALVAEVIAHRLQATRTRLLDLYGLPGAATGGAAG